MAKLVTWFLAFQACILLCRIAAARDATEDTILPGQQVTVISWGAKFRLDGKDIDDAELGASFMVDAVQGDLLRIKSRGTFLKRSDVVPYDKAVDYFTNNIKAKPSSDSFTRRGCFWDASGKDQLAIYDFSEAIRLNPYSSSAYINRAMVHSKKEELDRAISDYGKAIQIRRDDATPFLNRGICWRRKGDSDKAIADLNLAIQIDPRLAMAYSERGLAHVMKGDPDAAIVDCGIGIRIDPNEASSYRCRAHLYVDKGAFESALADYNELIRINRAAGLNELAWEQATSRYAKFRNGEKALRDATEACELTNWKHWESINTLSAALAEAGRFDEAIKRLQESNDVKSDPNAQKELCDDMMKAFRAGRAYTYIK